MSAIDNFDLGIRKVFWELVGKVVKRQERAKPNGRPNQAQRRSSIETFSINQVYALGTYKGKSLCLSESRTSFLPNRNCLARNTPEKLQLMEPNDKNKAKTRGLEMRS